MSDRIFSVPLCAPSINQRNRRAGLRRETKAQAVVSALFLALDAAHDLADRELESDVARVFTKAIERRRLAIAERAA